MKKKVDKIVLNIKLDKPDLSKNEWNFSILSEFQNCYPKKTNICCWWCCHTFTNPPLGIPKNYEPRNNTFRVVGCFCSLSCTFAYIHSNSEYRKVTKGDLILMYKKLTGGDTDLGFSNSKTLQKAPDRCTLAMFGGKLSIEQFRAVSFQGKTISVLMAPLIPHYMSTDDTNYGNVNLKIRSKTIVLKQQEANKLVKQKRTVGQLVSFVTDE